MVKDTTYYEILQVEVTVTDVELKKAYRKQAIRLHPDKNGNDPAAAAKFQELGEAYAILQNKELRALYDELGVEGMKNTQAGSDAADIDPAEFFKMIFGGDSFEGWIGELTMMTDMATTADILGEEEVETNQNTEVAVHDPSSAVNGSSYTELNEELQKKKKKKPKMTAEQRERLMAMLEESKRVKEARVQSLSDSLLSRVAAYQSAAGNPDAVAHFASKLRVELEDLKTESFGIQLLHLIGKTYVSQANAAILASKTFGVSKIFTSVKTKSNRVRSGFSIIKTAIDAQASAQIMLKEQAELEQSGKELTEEGRLKQMEAERIITGKFLATAWASTKFEVTGVLNKVMAKLLSDKALSKKERVSRAEAILFIGKELLATQRSAEEDEEARIFEEMMAEASAKKSKSTTTKMSQQEYEAYFNHLDNESPAEQATEAK